MSNDARVFKPRNDADLRNGLRPLYHAVVAEPDRCSTIVVVLPTLAWISANSLNLLLTFVEAVRCSQPRARLYIDVIDNDAAEALLSDGERSHVSAGMVKAITQKLIFYDAMGFVTLLHQASVVTRPAPSTISELQVQLDARSHETFFQHSTRMLSLSPLIETEEEQYALTTRIKTLTGILYKNLFARIGLEDLEEASDQIMFELVKNIYQHSDLPAEYRSRARGFACAQINKRPLVEHDAYPKVLVGSVLEGIKRGITGKDWQWLCISINDFGVGLTNKVSRFLASYLRHSPTVHVGRFRVDGSALEDHVQLAQIAATTDFSSKTVRTVDDELWRSGDKEVRLAAKGYGLVYCVSFIARTFGRMRVRSGPAEIDILPKPETPLMQDVWSNVDRASVRLQEHFSDDFNVRTNLLSEESASFPGTQIAIEIPVEVWTTRLRHID